MSESTEADAGSRWQLFSARVTIFPAATLVPAKLDLWGKVGGGRSKIMEQTREMPPPLQRTQAGMLFPNSQLSLQIEANKVDLVISGTVAATSGTEIPFIPHGSGAMKALFDAAVLSLSAAGTRQRRVAFNAHFICVMKAGVTQNDFLKQEIPGIPLSDTDREVIFQRVNKISVPQLGVDLFNHIEKWSAAGVDIEFVQPPSGVKRSHFEIVQKEEEFNSSGDAGAPLINNPDAIRLLDFAKERLLNILEGR